MKKINQADGAFKIELEAADGDILRTLGRRPGRLRGTFSDASQLHPILADALPTATVIEYVPPTPPSFESLKQQKIQQIDSRTSELIKSGFEFDGHNFSMSEPAQRNWTGLGTARSNNLVQFPLPISTIGEDIYNIQDDSTLLQFIITYMTYMTDPNQPLGAGRILRAQVSNSTTQEELDAVVDDR